MENRKSLPVSEFFYFYVQNFFKRVRNVLFLILNTLLSEKKASRLRSNDGSRLIITQSAVNPLSKAKLKSCRRGYSKLL